MKEYLVGWGTLALLNAAIANADRRSPLKYFLVSLFLGPLLTMVLAATREDESKGLKQIDLWKGR